MRNHIRLWRTALLVCAFCLFCPAAQAEERSVPLRLVAGTELIADIARDLLDGKAEILTLVPAASCPGHHDTRASDIAFIGKADTVLLHGWQKDLPAVGDALRAAQKPGLKPEILQAAGSWLVPEHQKTATRNMAEILSTLPGSDPVAIAKRRDERIARVDALNTRCLEQLRPYAGTPVLAAAMQEEFVGWTGMKVTASYGRGEDMNPGTLMSLARESKASGVRIVIDNMQSGGEAGEPLARELNATHIAFSNFPGSSPEVPTYESLVEHNCSLLLEALKKQSAGAKQGLPTS